MAVLRRRRAPRALAAVAALAVLAPACTDDAGTVPVTTAPASVGATSTPGGGSSATTSTTAPARGGLLLVGATDRSHLLDPLVAAPDGTGRGTEMLAVYDSLVRFDHTTGTFRPQLAESLVANPEHTVWTLTLRNGVTFSDGTPFDAAAVKFALDRHRVGADGVAPCAELRACGRTSPAARASMASVRSIEVIDPRTLVLTLAAPWVDFPWVLATEPGMIPSPTALRAVCPADPAAAAATCAFATAPVGAGPYVVTSVADGVVTMARNPRTADGGPALDGVRFVPLPDDGASRSLDQLTTGVVDVALLRDARAVTSARDKRFLGHAVLQYAGAVEVLNLHADTQPATRFLRVRLAIGAAIDPVAVHERVTGVRDGRAGELFAPDGPYATGEPLRAYEPERARALVAEAKANGWDGRVRYLCDNSQVGQARGIAVETMLKAAGIDPVIDTTRDPEGVRALVASRTFDLVCGSFGDTHVPEARVSDGTTVGSLPRHLGTGGDANAGGWASPAADAALAALRAARTEAERRSAARAVTAAVAADVPVVVTGVPEHLVAWHPRVRGVRATAGTRLLLDGAWLAPRTGG